MAFEIERLKDGIKYRHGSKGSWKTIDQSKTDKMYQNALGLMYRVDIPDVLDIYAGLSALRLDSSLIKMKVVKGMVREQVYRPVKLELPPEVDSGAEE